MSTTQNAVFTFTSQPSQEQLKFIEEIREDLNAKEITWEDAEGIFNEMGNIEIEFVSSAQAEELVTTGSHVSTEVVNDSFKEEDSSMLYLDEEGLDNFRTSLRDLTIECVENKEFPNVLIVGEDGTVTGGCPIPVSDLLSQTLLFGSIWTVTEALCCTPKIIEVSQLQSRFEASKA